jgi:hypothetical protein
MNSNELKEQKYPAHDCLYAYLENIPKDSPEVTSPFGWFGCYYGSIYDIEREFTALESKLNIAVEALEAREQVCGEVYQLLGQLDIPRLQDWLDNLTEGRLVHTDLLPVEVKCQYTVK